MGDRRVSNGGLGIYINRGHYLHVLGGAVVGGLEVVGVGPEERVVEPCVFTALSRAPNLSYREARPVSGVEEGMETGAVRVSALHAQHRFID